MENNFSLFDKLAFAYVSIILVLPMLNIIEIGSFIWFTGILVGSYIFTMFAVDSFKKKFLLRAIFHSLTSIVSYLAIITYLLDSFLKFVL